jgi:hypothetical protein
VNGTVTLTGAPRGFVPPNVGAGACPDTGPPSGLCSDPQYALGVNGQYTLVLTPGTWRIAGFYEINAYGGAFIGPSQVVSVPAGSTITENLTVPYARPASLTGTVRVTGVPAALSISPQALLCPSYALYSGGFPSIACVSESSSMYPTGNSITFKATGLPPGPWTVYPGYCTNFGSYTCPYNTGASKTVTLVGSHTKQVAVSTPLVLPGEGLVTGTITVTGAPPGFSDQLGVSVCQSGGQNCQSAQTTGANSYALLLNDGSWSAQGVYLVPPFFNAIVGPSTDLTVADGTTTLNLTVPYQELGGAAGRIVVTGLPARKLIQSYTVLACPSSSPWTGGEPALTCINEYSGAGGYGGGLGAPARASRLSHARGGFVTRAQGVALNVYQLPTLTPGSWLLYAGYQSDFGAFVNPVGTPVNITAGTTVTRNLSVVYQPPSYGLVAGTVDVIGVPPQGFEAGVQACNGPWGSPSCTDQELAFAGTNGTYQLPLSPGTWYVQGFLDVFSQTEGSEAVSAIRKVTVVAGTRRKANFTVRLSG